MPTRFPPLELVKRLATEAERERIDALEAAEMYLRTQRRLPIAATPEGLHAICLAIVRRHQLRGRIRDALTGRWRDFDASRDGLNWIDGTSDGRPVQFWQDEAIPPPARTGAPKTTTRALIRDEFERRASQGWLPRSLAEAARQLREWSRKEYPGSRVPTQESTENSLRKLYRNAKFGTPPNGNI
jgi:hypothetical protein